MCRWCYQGNTSGTSMPWRALRERHLWHIDVVGGRARARGGPAKGGREGEGREGEGREGEGREGG